MVFPQPSETFREDTEVLLLVDWLAFSLTGRFTSDDSIQTSTGWLDINKRRLWPEMLTAIDLRADQLPEILPCGMLLKWFRREFAHQKELAALETGTSVYELLDRLAETGKGWVKGLFLLPDFEGKLTPVPNPGACGVLFDLTLDTTRADMARALLESVGFMLKENIAMLEAYGVQVDAVRSLGGGSKSQLWGKIKADITQKSIYPQAFSESTSLRAAMLGQVASGVFSDLESAFAAAVNGAVEEEIRPERALATVVCTAYEQYKLVYQSLMQAFRGFRR